MLAGKMSLISGMDRSSPEYLKALEDELSKIRVTKDSLETELDKYKSDEAAAALDTGLDATFQLINDRLAKLEVSITTPGTPPPSIPPPAIPPRTIPPAPATAGTSPAAPGPTGPAAPATSPPVSGGIPSAWAPTSSHTGILPVIPAHAMGNPLTSALQRIASPDLQLGREFDPGTYVLATKSAVEAKSFDHSKMDLNDLFYGWMKVATNIVASAGDIKAYLSHLAKKQKKTKQNNVMVNQHNWIRTHYCAHS